MSQKPTRKLQSLLKFVLLIFFIASIIFVSKNYNLQAVYHKSIIWVESLGIWAPIAYIAIYNLAAILFIPGSILTIKGGCIFGLFWGSIYVLIAATLGATLAFLIGRYLSRQWVSQKISKYPQFQAIDRAVAREGLKIVFLTRLSPLFPFNLLNYAFGVTQVSLKDYILGSLGMIPGTVLYVYIGTLADGLAAIDGKHIPSNSLSQIGQGILQIIGLLAAIATTIYIGKISRQALQESVTEAQTQADDTRGSITKS